MLIKHILALFAVDDLAYLCTENRVAS